jgi:pSer/pThr/pTyr-binding forkhead associated (FHA) protein
MTRQYTHQNIRIWKPLFAIMLLAGVAVLYGGVQPVPPSSQIQIPQIPALPGAADNNHILIQSDNYVSGNHCCLRFEHELLRLYDHNSTNKTFLNDKALSGSAAPVRVGDRIGVGRPVFVVEAANA